jgi:hypothetical protein
MDPRMFAPADIAGSYQQGVQFSAQQDQRQLQQDRQRRLADLLPQAAQGNRGAINQIAGIDPEMFMKLDDRQREQAKAETADLTSAVRWAQTPEQWAQVQQYYGPKGVDLSGYGFEQREQAMLRLGKIGEYLNSAPKNDATSMQRNYEFLRQQNPQLADQYLRGQAEGSPIVQRNEDGTMTVYPRSMLSGGQSQGQPAPPPPPGFVIDGGQMGSRPSGNFQP